VREPAIDAEIRSWPTLSFYYHLGFNELARMPRWAIRLYLDELPKLRAQHELMLIEATGMAYMDAADQKTVIQQLNDDLQGHRSTQHNTRREPEVSKEQYLASLAAFGLSLE
jgi:hypothetical protein